MDEQDGGDKKSMFILSIHVKNLFRIHPGLPLKKGRRTEQVILNKYNWFRELRSLNKDELNSHG